MEKQPLVDNAHVAPGCEQFSPETIALNAATGPVPLHANPVEPDWTLDDTALAKKICSYLGQSTAESNDPGDRMRDQIAAWISAHRSRPVEPAREMVWPDFVAPPKYVNPAEGWTDPRLPDFRLIWETAREVGYAVGLHGSMKRDCDLIAVPWVEDAAKPSQLINRLCVALNARQIGVHEDKPHNRIAVTLQVDGYVKQIDLSIVRTSTAIRAEAIEECAKDLKEIAALFPLGFECRSCGGSVYNHWRNVMLALRGEYCCPRIRDCATALRALSTPARRTV